MTGGPWWPLTVRQSGSPQRLGTSSLEDLSVSKEAWNPEPPRSSARRPGRARAPGVSHCRTHVPPGAPGRSPAPQEAQLSSSARGPGRGGALAPGPRRVYRDVERGLQETVWQAGPRQMDCQLISMYL